MKPMRRRIEIEIVMVTIVTKLATKIIVSPRGDKIFMALIMKRCEMKIVTMRDEGSYFFGDSFLTIFCFFFGRLC